MDRDSLVLKLVELLDEDLRYEFEERAGIMEFDGGMDRQFAECMALLDVYSRHPLSIIGLSLRKLGAGQYVLVKDPVSLDRLGIRHMGSAELSDVISDFGGVVLLMPHGK